DADYVLVSGHNGGTGASPLSSIKHAGSPWELGLAETQALLIENGLRHRIEVRVDGGFRTGRDVVIAALLGAETYGFGTAALVAIGCDMARQCHLNSCPTGIATQRPELRKKFAGKPEQVVAYFTWIAEDVRRILAELVCQTLDEIIGRAELLERVDHPEVPRAQMLDLSVLLADPVAGHDAPRRRTVARNDRPGVESLDEEILPTLGPRLEGGRPFAVRNSGAIAVIEGAGAHCCEYMTAGVVVVLGPVGRNFAAGMSNGVAYVLDEAGTFTARCNGDMVQVGALEPSDEARVLGLVR